MRKKGIHNVMQRRRECEQSHSGTARQLRGVQTRGGRGSANGAIRPLLGSGGANTQRGMVWAGDYVSTLDQQRGLGGKRNRGA